MNRTQVACIFFALLSLVACIEQDEELDCIDPGLEKSHSLYRFKKNQDGTNRVDMFVESPATRDEYIAISCLTAKNMNFSKKKTTFSFYSRGDTSYLYSVSFDKKGKLVLK